MSERREWVWQDKAACADSEPGMFWPDLRGRARNGISTSVARHTADRYCRHCPVLTECFEYAMKESHAYGAGISGQILGGHLWLRDRGSLSNKIPVSLLDPSPSRSEEEAKVVPSVPYRRLPDANPFKELGVVLG